jgi:hypothetical protein
MYYTTEFDLEKRILNGACISISNLPENVAWQTDKGDLRPEARGPLKSGAWGGRPTCHPQTAACAPYSDIFNNIRNKAGWNYMGYFLWYS